MMPRMSLGLDSGAEPVGGARSGGAIDATAVRDFVRTAFSVRRNVVKVWRAIPKDIWLALDTPADRELSERRERRAAVGTAILIGLLIAGFGSTGYRVRVGGVERDFPLIGKSSIVGSFDTDGLSRAAGSAVGWYYAPGQSLVLVLWVVGPPLAGWALIRWFWIPTVVREPGRRDSVLAFARHLLSVYLFVFLMVVVGCALMPALILLSPAGTESFRWYLWCFLFGESFFVPAVMWGRFVIADRDGAVFGRHRFVWLGLYASLCVLFPILGMLQQLG